MRKCCLIVLGAVWAGAMGLGAATFQEDFASDPLQHGWQIAGESSLFHWNSTNQNLEVTWSSTNVNSLFYHPLGTVVATNDDFAFSFDLRLKDAWAENLFEIAVGMLKVGQASQSNYYRGTGVDSPNLCELAFFPDTGWGATICPTLVDTNNNWASGWFYQDLTPNVLFHVEMNYSARSRTLSTIVTSNGEPYLTASTSLGSAFKDFRLDAFSITSYSEAGQSPEYMGRVLAHGTIDNVVITTPDALVIPLAQNGAREVHFASRTNWFYRLEGSSDLKTWTEAASSYGTGGTLSLSDASATTNRFYRVAAERP